LIDKNIYGQQHAVTSRKAISPPVHQGSGYKILIVFKVKSSSADMKLLLQ